MKLEVRTFQGLRPQCSPDLLNAGEAVVANNLRLISGELRPLNDLGSTLATLSGGTQVVSIYRYGQLLNSQTQYWFQGTVDTDFVKGQVNEDTTERTFWTDGVFPKKGDSSIVTSGAPYPSASYAMGLPLPASAPSVAVSGSPTLSTSPVEAVNYVCTYVSAWGEESGPSPASSTVSWQLGQTINVTSIPGAPGTGPQGQNYSVAKVRLYRAATGTSATEYQFLVELTVGTTTYNDTTVTSSLGVTLQTIDWREPHYNMIGLCAGPNGMMAGFVGTTLCFNVPFTPYAWKTGYEQSTDAPIVGIAWFDQSVFIGTTQGIYVCSGADPGSMTMNKLAVAQSLAAKRAVCSMLGGVYFAAPDGLFRIDSSGINCVSDGLMSRQDWQSYVPSSMMFYESDNRLVIFYNNGTKTGSLIFTVGQVPSLTTCDVYAYGAYRDKKYDTLYVVDGSNHVKAFDGGSALSWDYQSNIFHLNSDENMAAALVDASAYPVTFKLYCEGSLIITQTVANNYAFRLPGGYRGRRFQFEVSGSSNVRAVLIGTTMADLAG